jgi:simple sugar transport system permease protein
VQSERLLRQPMSNSGTLPESLEIPAATKLPFFLGDESMPINIGLPLTVLLGLGAAWLLARSLFGLHLRAVGLNPLASRQAGMPIARTVVLAMTLAGAIMLQGDQYALKSGFSSGYGFDGLVVGLLARGSLPGVFAGALLFGFLRSGGINMEMAASVPSSLVQVVQGMIILAVAGAALWMDRHGAGK